MNLPKIWQLLKETFQEWQADNASRLAAALAYYTVFSISPLLVIAIAIAGAFFGQDKAQAQITQELIALVGEDGVKPIILALDNISQPEIRGIASLISIGVLLLGASGIFAQLQDALNTVWKVQPKPGKGIGQFIRKRIFSFFMVLAIGFLLMLSLVLSAVVSTVSKYRTDFLPGSAILWENLDFIVSLGLMTFLFGLMFKYVPDAKIVWKDVFVGAIITALLFLFGKFLLGMYLSGGTLGSAYGAAGSLIVFLAWVYYSAQIVLLGAEFTQVYARMYGSKLRPTRHSQLQ
jgi:membrane protein